VEIAFHRALRKSTFESQKKRKKKTWNGVEKKKKGKEKRKRKVPARQKKNKSSFCPKPSLPFPPFLPLPSSLDPKPG
jgi:hypothetical protein